ncbi:SlyX family protein [Chitinophaga flava]|uniref:F5/8 type C domain-containing protein n=1 Tax=Chitinophaga flava TaxID=2259036 RepID=A0A365XVB5_9BACT|nr:SlyX family protein [Chitinophaga flava]RBL89961.1 hypothetical protein DF182_26160 [Chitinophaga flava]
MKKLWMACALLLPASLYAQTATLVPPANISYAGLEKNLFFYANTRCKVTQTGSNQLDLNKLFDGRYDPSYTSAPSESDPTVITIEGFQAQHTQRLAYIGWTTRYWAPVHFKIEGYDMSGPGWVTLAEVTNHAAGEFIKDIASIPGLYGLFRFTFYTGSGPQGQLGISELFYLNGEAAQAYDGLMVRYDAANNVTMGSKLRPSNLNVNGQVNTNRVKVTQDSWADFVFDPAYTLPSLPTVEKFIQDNQHLPNIPSAKEVTDKGLDLGDISARLLQKIEELTLYMIEQHKKIETLTKENQAMGEKIQQLQNERSTR